MTIYNYVDTVTVFIIPFTTIVILNSFTSLEVLKVAGLRRKMTAHKRYENIIIFLFRKITLKFFNESLKKDRKHVL